jgi:hypothetical protein
MTLSAYSEGPYRPMSCYDITRVVQNFTFTPLLVLSSISVPSLAALVRL